VAWDGRHFTLGLLGPGRGVHCPGPEACLNHHQQFGEPGNDPVSAWEAAWEGGSAGLHLRDHGAIFLDKLMEGAVPCRVWDVYPGAQNGYGAASSLNGRSVGGGIDPAGESADHHIAGPHGGRGQLACRALAVLGGVAGADNRHRLLSAEAQYLDVT
jgi:hypothetical protein